MAGETDLATLIRTMRPVLGDEIYVFVVDTARQRRPVRRRAADDLPRGGGSDADPPDAMKRRRPVSPERFPAA